MQLGVGISGGSEAIVHAVNIHLSDTSTPASDKLTLLVDFSNAFHSITRDVIFLKSATVFHLWLHGLNAAMVVLQICYLEFKLSLAALESSKEIPWVLLALLELSSPCLNSCLLWYIPSALMLGTLMMVPFQVMQHLLPRLLTSLKSKVLPEVFMSIEGNASFLPLLVWTLPFHLTSLPPRKALFFWAPRFVLPHFDLLTCLGLSLN